jgi:hypothetical protein
MSRSHTRELREKRLDSPLVLLFLPIGNPPDGAWPAARITLVLAGDESTVFKKLECALDIDTGLVPTEEIVNLSFVELLTGPERTKNSVSNWVTYAASEDPP